nr:zinc finger, CCHC-type [Tanacetum cinerariifolium]
DLNLCCPNNMVFISECKAEIWVAKGLLDKAKGTILGHLILSLEDSLSRDCYVEKNGKWLYAVGIQEYRVVCTTPDIASVDVGIILADADGVIRLLMLGKSDLIGDKCQV